MDHLQRECLGRLFENALGLLGALQEVADLRRGGDLEDQLFAKQQRQFVAEQHLAGIGHRDRQAIVLRFDRHKVEAEHQVRGNAAEQLRIDALFAQIDESAAVSLRELARDVRARRAVRRRAGVAIVFVGVPSVIPISYLGAAFVRENEKIGR